MCTTCGCSGDGALVVIDARPAGAQPESAGHAHGHGHHHDHGHGPARGSGEEPGHDHGHGPHGDMHEHTHARDHTTLRGEHDAPASAATGAARTAAVHGRTIALEQEILAKNRLLAERNRGWFAAREILALNLMSSPGAGKTTLLERTISDLGRNLSISVIEGDQATATDARRILATGCKAVQINTGTGCHLDATMLARGLAALAPPPRSVVMIENVGNLVCPALFDLGEHARVVILSVTEGEDKPIKYPHMFRTAQLVLLNKIDLLPHVRFDVQTCIEYARQVNPRAPVLPLSAMSGAGLDAWYAWLKAQHAAAAAAATDLHGSA